MVHSGSRTSPSTISCQSETSKSVHKKYLQTKINGYLHFNKACMGSFWGMSLCQRAGNQEGGFAKRHPELMTQPMTHANNHWRPRLEKSIEAIVPPWQQQIYVQKKKPSTFGKSEINSVWFCIKTKQQKIIKEKQATSVLVTTPV